LRINSKILLLEKKQKDGNPHFLFLGKKETKKVCVSLIHWSFHRHPPTRKEKLKFCENQRFSCHALQVLRLKPSEDITGFKQKILAGFPKFFLFKKKLTRSLHSTRALRVV